MEVIESSTYPRHVVLERQRQRRNNPVTKRTRELTIFSRTNNLFLQDLELFSEIGSSEDVRTTLLCFSALFNVWLNGAEILYEIQRQNCSSELDSKKTSLKREHQPETNEKLV